MAKEQSTKLISVRVDIEVLKALAKQWSNYIIDNL